MHQPAPTDDEHRYRRQHDPVERADNQVLDSNGMIGHPWRVEGLLASWERAKTITPQMRAAGEEFHRLFQIAALQHLRAADMGRASASGSSSDGHAIEAARRKRDKALDHLGGMHSYAGSCAWYVLGEEQSIRAWSMRAGRGINPRTGKGVLIGALDALAWHFGLAKTRPHLPRAPARTTARASTEPAKPISR